MKYSILKPHSHTVLLLFLTAAFVAGCGSDQPAEQATSTMSSQATEQPTPTPASATVVTPLPPSADNQLFALYHRAGQTAGDTVEIRRNELRNTNRKDGNEVCEVVSLDDAGRALIWDPAEWSSWNAWQAPTNAPAPGTWIWSVEVTYQGQTRRMSFLTDDFDNGPLQRAIGLAGSLRSQGAPKPCPPTPSI